MKSSLLLSSIIFISLFTFWPSFNLGLFGDDWLAFFRYLQYLGPNAQGSWNHLTYFLTSYGPEDMIMGLLQKIYGYNSMLYYLTSYFLRLIASFSLYPLVFYLTRNKLSSFLAVLFFSITSIGLETTNWVFNMPSYIAITFLNLFLYFYIRSKDERKIEIFVASILFLFLAIVSQPIRMHGLLPFILIMEFFWLIRGGINQLSQALIRIGVFASIFAITLLFLSSSPVVTGSILFTDGVKAISKLLNEGRLDFLFNPLIILGGFFTPEPIFQTNKIINLIFSVIVLTIWLILLVRNWPKKDFATSLVLSFALMISSYLTAWWRFPDSIIFTTHRYLIVSAVGVSIFIAVLAALGKSPKIRLYLALGMMSLILLNIISTYKYLNNQVQNHGIDISNKIWSKIPIIEEVGKNNETYVFYFVGDGTNVAIMHDVITFGFPPHMALLYHISEEYRVPVAIDDWKELESAVIDGKAFARHGYPLKPVPPERVYAFYLQGKDNLIDVTDIVRNKLRELK